VNKTALLLSAWAVSATASPQDSRGPQDPPVLTGTPERSRGTGGGCTFQGPFLHIPSKTGGAEGLLVRVSPPAKPRYESGAPVAVHVISALPNVTGSIACLSEQGFVDVGFLCPGVQYRAPDGIVMKSGGSGFPPGPSGCVEAIADVLAFTTGQTRSVDGKSIQDVAGVKIADNTGVIGWSLGGNLSVHAMARFGDRLPGLKWYASWESPMLGTNEDLGNMIQPNPFYDAKTGRIDFSRLRYSAEMPIWVFPTIPLGPGRPRGGLYLDGDGNGKFNRDADFAFFANIGGPAKFFYSPTVTHEAADRKVFGADWPKHIATLAEADARFAQEDPLVAIPNVVKRFPSLSVLVFESRQNHVIDATDHPQAIAQVNAWIDAKAHWVRFNPDATYVQAIMGRKPSRVVQYPAGAKLDRNKISNLLEPEMAEGGPSDKQGMTAAVCELADRTERNNWSPKLKHTLR